MVLERQCMAAAHGKPHLCWRDDEGGLCQCAVYTAGKLKPAYPMPAIPMVVHWNWWGDHYPQILKQDNRDGYWRLVFTSSL